MKRSGSRSGSMLSSQREYFRTHRAIHKCEVCGWVPSGRWWKHPIDGLEMHHIVPVSAGGTDDLDNLIAICANCHRLAHRIWRLQKVWESRAAIIAQLREALGNPEDWFENDDIEIRSFKRRYQWKV